MLIKEAIERILKDLGVSTDDTFFGNRYVYMVLKAVRSELLRQEVEKKGIWTNFPMQTLRRFSLEQIDISEYARFGFIAGESVLRSTDPFPDIMDTKDGKILAGVFLPTGQRLDVVSYTATIITKNRRYQSNQPVAYMRDGHLYVRFYPNTTPRLYVDVDGIFENPEEVDKYNALNNSTEDCSTLDNCVYYPDLPFYLPGYLEGRFFRIAKQDLSWSMRIPKDHVNNGVEDLASQRIPDSQQQPER